MPNPDPPVDQQDDDRAPPDTPEADDEVVPVLLSGQEEYLRAEVGRHR